MSVFFKWLYKTPFTKCSIFKCLCIIQYTNKPFKRAFTMANVKRLAAFDFDKTILIDNSDTVVKELLPKDVVPAHIRNGWTSYMGNIFELLHSNGIDRSAIDQKILSIAPIAGMCELIKELSETLNFDVIIISDSNSHFINIWLKQNKLDNNIKKVFTNPAEFVDGLLKIEKYHLQDWCNLSEKNLCKGYILEEFIKIQQNAGIIYNKVIYVGDGQNDFCPILRLNPGDLACCRAGFKCADLVQNAKANKPIGNQLYEIKADVHIWNDGFDVLNAVKAVV